MTPKLVVFQSWKKLQALEKNVFRKKKKTKKTVQLICADTIFKTVCGDNCLTDHLVKFLQGRINLEELSELL